MIRWLFKKHRYSKPDPVSKLLARLGQEYLILDWQYVYAGRGNHYFDTTFNGLKIRLDEAWIWVDDRLDDEHREECRALYDKLYDYFISAPTKREAEKKAAAFNAKITTALEQQ